jgi:hypothetical protein
MSSIDPEHIKFIAYALLLVASALTLFMGKH